MELNPGSSYNTQMILDTIHEINMKFSSDIIVERHIKQVQLQILKTIWWKSKWKKYTCTYCKMFMETFWGILQVLSFLQSQKNNRRLGEVKLMLALIQIPYVLSVKKKLDRNQTRKLISQSLCTQWHLISMAGWFCIAPVQDSKTRLVLWNVLSFIF